MTDVGFSLLGSLEAYGLKQVISQGYEKLVVDPERYRHIHGEESVPVRPLPAVPKSTGKQNKTVVLVVHSYYPDSGGGTERFGKNLAAALRMAGNRVILLAYSARVFSAYPNRYAGIVYVMETIDEIPVIRFRHRRPNGAGLKDIPKEDPALEKFARELFSQIHPDVVHFLHLSRINPLTGVCQYLNIPYFVTVTDFFALCHSSTRIDRFGGICGGCKEGARCKKACPTIQIKAPEERYRNALRLLKGAEAVVTPSAYTAGVFQREFPGLKTSVIPHGIGLAPFRRARSGAVRRFLFVGRLSDVKGVGFLISAFHNMPPDCSLRIYGDGPTRYKSNLKHLAAKDKRIAFYGLVPPESIAEVYQEADCVVVPSLVPETYNFVVREALQSGCLVVASAVGAIPEVVVEGRNGFLVPCGQKEELHTGLMRAYDFSWDNWTSSQFPNTRDEAASYSYLYEQIKEV
ncbi:glycosyltransferase [Pseudoflavonifractor sp. 524-17]|nr:glycosyltransferase [Pseudoflavonifractor sp. 524-17]